MVYLAGMKRASRSIDQFIACGILFALFLSGTESITCKVCDNYFDPTNCTSITNDKTVDCGPSVKTCVIGTGTRPELKGGVIRQIPAMGRRCSLPDEQDKNYEEWKSANAKGHKMICYITERDRDRKCICGEDNCNNQIWDEVMVQPLLQASQSATDVPMIPTLGDNALAKMAGVTYSSKVPWDRVTGGSVDQSPGTASTAVDSTPVTKSAESAGSSVELLAGAAVGGLFLVGLIGFAIYWFKFRRRSEPASADTSVSTNTADAEAEQAREEIIIEEAEETKQD